MRLSNIKRLFLVQLGSQGSNFLLQLIALPVFISAWQPGLYGAWLTLMSLPLFLSQLDVGFGTASGPAMSKSLSDGRHDRARNLFWFALCATFCIGLVSASLLAVVAAQGWVVGDPHYLSRADSTVILFSGASMVFTTMTLRCGWALLMAVDRQVLGDIIVNSAFVAEGVLTIVMLLSGSGPVSLALALSGTRLCFLGLLMAVASKQASWIWGLQGMSARAWARSARRLLRPAAGYFAEPMSAILQNQGVVFLAGACLGSIYAPIVLSHRLLTRVAWFMNGGLRSVTYGELARLYAWGDVASFRRHSIFVASASLWVSVLCCAGLAVLGPLLMHWWLGGHQEINLPLLYMFTFTLPAMGFLFGTKIVLSAANRHLRLNLTEFILSATVFALTAALCMVYKSVLLIGVASFALGIILYIYSVYILAQEWDLSYLDVHRLVLFGAPTACEAEIRTRWRAYKQRKQISR